MNNLVFVLVITLVLTTCALAKEYKQGDLVDLWAYSVFPAANPQERYPYSSAELCSSTSTTSISKDTKDLSFGEMLAGYRYERLPYAVKYLEASDLSIECADLLTPAKLRHLERLVLEGYWYEWSVDGLPAWAPLGSVVNGRAYLYTHRALNISHDGSGRITAATLTVSDARALADYAAPAASGAQIPLTATYSVAWGAASTDPEHRLDRYLELDRFGGLQRFLGTLFALILALFVASVSLTAHPNTTTATTATPTKSDTTNNTTNNNNTPGLCAAAGLGAQIAFAAAATACAGLFGAKFAAPGELAGRLALMHALGGAAGGYAGARAYCALDGAGGGGRRWLRVALLGMCGALPLAAYGVWTLVNAVGAWYGSLVAAPLGTQAMVAAWQALVVTPVTLLGAFVARRRFVRNGGLKRGRRQVALGHNHAVRKGGVAWKNRVMMGAAWAFGYFCVAVEINYVIIAIWEYGTFMGYGYTFFSLGALGCCAGKMGVTVTVFLWNNGCAEWRRNAFVSGAGVAIPVMLHFALYYARKSAMSGFLQFVAFFSVAGAISLALALSCGSIALLSVIKYIEDLNTSDKKE